MKQWNKAKNLAAIAGRAGPSSLPLGTAGFAAPVAEAQPIGGVTVAGDAAVAQSGAATTVTQHSDRAIIRWDQFNLAPGERVDFHQPSSTSITVNRIHDNAPSQIDGALNANGRIVMINPNGMVFGTQARVNVGGLVATSSDIGDDAAFMRGGPLHFDQPGAAAARIVNNGQINVGQAGLVGLVAPHVENNGSIVAQLGKVALASGDIHTVDMAGDGLIQLEASDALLAQSVTNRGLLQADGGTVLLSAAQARREVDTLITHSGRAVADSVGGRTGSVEVRAGPNGKALIGGDISARGKASGERGGRIDVTGGDLALASTARLNASGAAGGGAIRIGGDYQGTGALTRARSTRVEAGARLSANASEAGDAGSIVAWADGSDVFYGHAEATAAAGQGGMLEISGKDYLDFGGTVDMRGAAGNGSLLLDPTNITISSAASSNVTGATPYAPTADDVTSILNATTLLAALATGDVTVATRATGAQAGDILVNAALNWASNSVLTLSAHNLITVNSAINAGTGGLVLDAADVAVNAALSGGGTLTFRPRTDAATLGIGASAVGSYNLGAAELANLTDGWSNIVFGRATATGAMDIRATTWTDNLTLQSGSGAIGVNGIVNVGANNLTLNTDGDIALNIANGFTGTGNLTVTPVSVGTTLGLSGGAGTINLTATEVGRIATTFANLFFGRVDGTGAMNVGTATWNSALTLQTGSGALNVTGIQTMGSKNLSLVTDSNLSIGAALTGTGTLSISQASAATSLGLGTGQSGTLLVDTTELGSITNGWANLIFGRTDGSGAVNVGALTWNDFLTLQSGTGVVSINGVQTLAANNFTLKTDANPLFAAAISGTTAFSVVQSSAGTTMGLGTGQAGTLSLDDSELANITNGWASLTFGRTDGSGAVNVGTASWNDVLTLQSGSGALNINGTQTMLTNNLTLRTDADPVIAGNLSGTGTFTLIQSSAGTSMGLGNAQSGTVNLDSTELGKILNGWASLIFGRTDGTGAFNLGAASWNDVLTLRTGSGAMNISGNQILNANALTINSDADVALGGTLSGTSTFTFAPTLAATSIGLGNGQAGTVLFDDAELNRILNGFSGLVFGTVTSTGAMNLGARTWNDVLTLRTGSGQMNINGAQTLLTNALTIQTDSNLLINGNLSSSGALIIQPSAAATSIAIGTGQSGTLLLDDSELNRILDGWSSQTFGNTGVTGTFNIGARNWLDSVSFRNSTGQMTVAGAQNTNANNLTFTTNSNLAVNANLTGTGTLTVTGSSGGTSMGLGTGQAGTLALDDTELGRIVDGWANLIFGSTSMTGAMNVAARTWLDNVDIRTSSGALNLNGAQNVGANNLVLRTNTNLNFANNLVGTGNLTIVPSTASTTIGVGTGQAGDAAAGRHGPFQDHRRLGAYHHRFH